MEDEEGEIRNSVIRKMSMQGVIKELNQMEPDENFSGSILNQEVEISEGEEEVDKLNEFLEKRYG